MASRTMSSVTSAPAGEGSRSRPVLLRQGKRLLREAPASGIAAGGCRRCGRWASAGDCHPGVGESDSTRFPRLALSALCRSATRRHIHALRRSDRRRIWWSPACRAHPLWKQPDLRPRGWLPAGFRLVGVDQWGWEQWLVRHSRLYNAFQRRLLLVDDLSNARQTPAFSKWSRRLARAGPERDQAPQAC